MRKTLSIITSTFTLAIYAFIAAFSLGGTHPPAHASPLLSDQLIDMKIAAVDAHISNTDKNVSETNLTVKELAAEFRTAHLEDARAIATLQTYIAVASTILGIATGGGLIIQSRKKD